MSGLKWSGVSPVSMANIALFYIMAQVKLILRLAKFEFEFCYWLTTV